MLSLLTDRILTEFNVGQFAQSNSGYVLGGDICKASRQAASLFA